MKELKKLYVETWWGDNLPNYIGMQVEVREVQPVSWAKAVTTRCISWAEERFRAKSKIVSFRFPVIKKDDLNMLSTIIKKRLNERGIKVECRVMENGMIDAYLVKKERVKAKEPKDRWSVFLRR